MQRAFRVPQSALSSRTSPLLCLVLLLAAVVAPRARADGEPGTRKYVATVRFRGQSVHALELLWQQDPVRATAFGMHRYDDRLASWSPAARAARLASLARVSAQLRVTDLAAMNPN